MDNKRQKENHMNPYQTRREQLFNLLPKSTLAILPGASEIPRNGDSHYPFRQSSDFYYLTGYNEPDSIALFLKTNDGATFFLLGVRPNDKAMEIWHGPRSGLDGAVSQFKADEAFDAELLDEKIMELLPEVDHVFYPISASPALDANLHQWILDLKQGQRRGLQVPKHFGDLAPLIHRMRLIKDNHEIILMKKAAKISADAHMAVMKAVAPGKNEYELEAIFAYTCMSQGAKHMAYNPIVGGGQNACVLHYNANDRVLQDNDLLLIDAGCEYEMYASDITRAYPVGKTFSKEQEAIYELVLSAQMGVIDKVKPGVCWNSLHQTTCEILTQGLIDLGILQGSLQKNLETEAYKAFFMHKTGHYIGMDVHDVGSYKDRNDWQKLETGMAFTVEPGLYILPETGVDEKWWHIGIRIEDDILVTSGGHENLTEGVAKKVSEIEAIRRSI